MDLITDFHVLKHVSGKGPFQTFYFSVQSGGLFCIHKAFVLGISKIQDIKVQGFSPIFFSH
ncbi:hypothetical protein P872_11300 [Rhodonellum psychrophilum GCM71 = DSM 17998]|uniref:Uncharacterized protein n=1 Tax=Rhodonellum psychrophilum GCM71 = DSM 17998 TaxID=1123057 RepID=U5BY32_9BACT|nr:hypothetical protein P872_11300 [Rhodonellum psychrophilum GCM71 = DSM 17998]